MVGPIIQPTPNLAVEPTAYSFGYAYAFGGGSPRAFGFQKYLAFSHGSRTINPERGALCHVNGLLQ